jgi:two-component system, LytTR family, response regulator
LERIRALIVDDEPIARQGLHTLLAAETGIEIIGQCGNGREAVKVIREQSPDLVFLDVQMPKMSGFDVVAELGAANMPAVVFVTAYDQYAIRAFEIDAMDYLLKPFDQERFQKTIDRIRSHFRQGSFSELNKSLSTLLTRLDQSEQKYIERIVIKSGGRIFFVNVDEIDWVEAAGNYVRLHVKDKSHLLRETMDAMSAKLAADRFLRIRRSLIVNIGQIKVLQPLFKGEYQITLQDGTQLRSSRRYRDQLNPLLGESA